MGRISSLFLAAWMCIGLVGCGGEESTDGPKLEAPAEGSGDASGSEKKEEGSEAKAE
ncbi:MAG: hypothetical protein MI725_01370 [Pirellulales bacterium]|nr:hypothetical protein [Pirellulales bacterium]